MISLDCLRFNHNSENETLEIKNSQFAETNNRNPKDEERSTIIIIVTW